MSRRPWIGLFFALVAVLALGTVSCADEVPDDEVSLLTAAAVPAGAGCIGLLNAVEKVCPGPSCAVIHRELIKHGCVEQPTDCPCALTAEPFEWWYYFGPNHLYCWGGEEFSRLAVCDPNGAQICVSNFNTPYEVEQDPALCDACRSFPLTATVVGDWPEPTVDLMDCMPPGSVSN